MSADHPNPVEAWNAYLREFHSAIPDATSSSIGRFTNAAGKTTYRLLAETLNEHAATSGTVRVLDLGCGDGRLVDEIAAVLGSRAAITGLDLSREEIERARSSGRPGRYVAGPAGAMPFETGSFDAVLSHFAFMLMQPVDGVVREIERVLTPGGFFATAVSWLARTDGDLAALLALRREASHGMTAPVQLSFDPRQRRPPASRSSSRMRKAGVSSRRGASASVPWSTQTVHGTILPLSTSPKRSTRRRGRRCALASMTSRASAAAA